MNNFPNRGEIWLIDWSPARGSEQKGIRPSLVLQSDKGNSNKNYPNTIILTITKQGKNIPFHVELNPNSVNGLNKISYIKCEQILTISKRRLVKKIGTIDLESLKKVENGVKLALDFS